MTVRISDLIRTEHVRPTRRPAGVWYATWISGGPVAVRDTRDEAVDALLALMRRMFGALAEPALLVTARPGLQALVDRTSDSWFYILHHDGRAGAQCGGWDTRREAEIHARRHMAQDCLDQEDGGLGVLRGDDFEGRREHARWLAWQRAYAAAKAEGLDDAACRERADRV